MQTKRPFTYLIDVYNYVSTCCETIERVSSAPSGGVIATSCSLATQDPQDASKLRASSKFTSGTARRHPEMNPTSSCSCIIPEEPRPSLYFHRLQTVESSTVPVPPAALARPFALRTP